MAGGRLEARLTDLEEQMAELVGHSEDMLAICGSRMYVFFIDAAVTERLLTAGPLSLLTFLHARRICRRRVAASCATPS